MRKSLTLVALMLVLPVLSCSGPAKSSVEDAEAAVNAVADDAAKYYPDQYEALQASLEGLREKFKEGKYSGVQMDSKMIQTRAEKLGELVVSKKREVTEQWQAVAADVPGLVEKLEAKVTELTALKRLPKEIDKAALEAAQSGVGELRETWKAALAEYDEGKPLSALEKALGVKDRAGELAAGLGLEPGA